MAKTLIKKTGKVYESQDYDKFSYINCNRDVDQQHVAQLKRKIQAKNLLHFNPIIVNKDLEIIDGQHRFWACVELGIPVVYRIEEDYTDDILVELNTGNKNWKSEDFVKYYATKGDEQYKRLKKSIDETGFSVSCIGKICATDLGKQVKHGEINYGPQMEKVLNDFLARWTIFAAYPFRRHTTFVTAFARLTKMRNFNMLRFTKMVEDHPDMLKKCHNVDDYLRLLASIHNLGLIRKKWVTP